MVQMEKTLNGEDLNSF